MCDGCDQFPFGCGSPLCLTGEEQKWAYQPEGRSIYITGDTHGSLDIDKLSIRNFPEQTKLTKHDYVIVAGDAGFLFSNSKREIELRKELASRNFRLLYIEGNHEGFDALNSLPKTLWHGGYVHFINESIIHLCRGQIFNLHGQKFFTFGGAESIDRTLRIEGVSWWPQEMPSNEEYAEGLQNLAKVNWQVDYIITHDCSVRTFRKLKELVWLDNERDPLRDYLDEVEERVTYKHWYFGHYHEDMQVDNKHTLLFQNVIKIL